MKVETVVVSLVSSSERRKLVEENLSRRADFEWCFFDALTHEATVENLSNDKRRQLTEFGRYLTNGEIGCFHSHYSVLSEFVESGKTKWLLVLEDDVWMDPDFDIAELVKYSEENHINYMRLFAKFYKPADVVSQISGFRHIIRFRTDPYGTQAYLINKKGASSFLNTVNQITVPFDDALGRFWRHGLDAYCVFPFPVVERSISSSLTASRDDASESRTFFRFDRLMNAVILKVEKSFYNLRFKTRRSL